MNLFFLVDMILIFYSAYLVSDFNTVDDHKVCLNPLTLLDYRYKISNKLVLYRFDISDSF